VFRERDFERVLLSSVDARGVVVGGVVMINFGSLFVERSVVLSERCCGVLFRGNGVEGGVISSECC